MAKTEADVALSKQLLSASRESAKAANLEREAQGEILSAKQKSLAVDQQMAKVAGTILDFAEKEDGVREHIVEAETKRVERMKESGHYSAVEVEQAEALLGELTGINILTEEGLELKKEALRVTKKSAKKGQRKRSNLMNPPKDSRKMLNLWAPSLASVHLSTRPSLEIWLVALPILARY